jgi:hypothetical protein
MAELGQEAEIAGDAVVVFAEMWAGLGACDAELADESFGHINFFLCGGAGGFGERMERVGRVEGLDDGGALEWLGGPRTFLGECWW